MSSKFKNKVVLITGASSGIGKALAEEFYKECAKIILLARREDRILELEEKFNQNEKRAIAIVGDVNEINDQKEAVRQAIATFGKLDIVVANAGFGVVGSFENLQIEDYYRQFETNVFGVLKTAYASFEELKKNKGSFVIIGSVNSYVSFRGVSAYAMSKFSVRALSDSLRHEWRDYGVKVNLICPGYIESEIRQVDNKGVWHAQSAEEAPKHLRMSAPQASRIILKAIARNKRECVVTFHAKLGIFMMQHCPNLLHFLFRILKVRGRRSP